MSETQVGAFPLVTGSAPWIVSLVMIRDVAPGTQSIANYIDLFDAVSKEEALGKAIEASNTILPDYRLHVYNSMKINVPNVKAEPDAGDGARKTQ